MGNEAGRLGIPCKDFGSGCECGQCSNARGMHRTVAGNAGIPCKDFNSGCRCEMCQNARRMHNGALGLLAPDMSYTPGSPKGDMCLYQLTSLQLERFNRESINVTNYSDKHTKQYQNACGCQAVSWCLQAMDLPDNISYRNGPNQSFHLAAMLEEAGVAFETKAGLKYDEIDPHLRSGRPVMILLTSTWYDNFTTGGEFTSTGKYHWIVLTGEDSTDTSWYWIVSNGRNKGRIHSSIARFLVNNAIGRVEMGGSYAGDRVILVNSAFSLAPVLQSTPRSPLFRIVSKKMSGKCIHLVSGIGTSRNGDKCHLWDIQPGRWPAQEWTMDGNLIRSVKMPGKCIHLESGDGASRNGDKCHLWDIQPGRWPAQEWTMDGNLIRSVKTPGKCIHLESGDGASRNGDKCHLWDIQPGRWPAQEWTLEYL